MSPTASISPVPEAARATVTVHAYAAAAPGAPLLPFDYEFESAEPAPNQVEIAITHCGICHTDIHLINNDWGITQYPMVPGHEVVGVVTAAGPAVHGFPVGQRAGVGWESGSCGECEYCARGEENVCLGWKGTCTHGFGGYASAIRVDSRFAIPIPEALSSEHAAPLLCGGITVYSPLIEEVAPTSRVGVIGVGGLGHLALQFARAFGCEVTAFSTSPAKEEEARQFGAHHFVYACDATAMQKFANSLDLVISTAPCDVNWVDYINTLKPKGKLCLVGVPQSDMAVPAFPLILGRKSVFGNPVGSPSRIREMLEFAARNQISPRTELFPLAQVNEAIQRVRANEARYRVVLVN